MWGKNREKKGNRKSSRQKKPPQQSPTAMPKCQMAPSAATRQDVGISLPGGPFLSPLPPAQPQGGWEGRTSWKLLLLLVCRVEGRDKQNLNGLLGQGSERNQLLLAGGGGQGGHLGDSQNKATAPMKWMTMETVSFRSATDQGITETLQHSRVRKRGGEGGAKMWVWGGRHC